MSIYIDLCIYIYTRICISICIMWIYLYLKRKTVMGHGSSICWAWPPFQQRWPFPLSNWDPYKPLYICQCYLGPGHNQSKYTYFIYIIYRNTINLGNWNGQTKAPRCICINFNQSRLTNLNKVIVNKYLLWPEPPIKIKIMVVGTSLHSHC